MYYILAIFMQQFFFNEESIFTDYVGTIKNYRMKLKMI